VAGVRFRDTIAMVGVVCWAAGCSHSAPVTTPAPAPPATDARKAVRPSTRSPVHPSPRPSHADSLRLEVALFRERSSAPLARVLSRRSGNDLIAERAAAALLAESRRLGLSPSFAAAVLLVENTPMDTTAVSSAGAIGLMQVMPVHEGSWGCATELTGVESNICHGTHVLRMSLRRHRTVPAALRWYNGCVGKRVTRTCRRYPARVLRLASRIRRELLAMPPEPPPPPEPASAPPSYLRRVDTPDSPPPRWPTLSLLGVMPESSTGAGED
jgi:hypothetical protein